LGIHWLIINRIIIEQSLKNETSFNCNPKKNEYIYLTNFIQNLLKASFVEEK
jgi:hypothetical protein